MENSNLGTIFLTGMFGEIFTNHQDFFGLEKCEGVTGTLGANLVFCSKCTKMYKKKPVHF